MTDVAVPSDSSTDLQRAAQGDQGAFASLVREHQSMVFSLALHCLRDRALAEELAQDVFLQLYRNLGEIESPAHLKFWLRRVASHRAIDVARRRRWWPKFSLEDIPEPAEGAKEGDSLLSRHLQRLVATLPESQRAVVVLRYQEDLDPMEIAAVLEMPVATVKSYLHRALGMLRKKMEKGGPK